MHPDGFGRSPSRRLLRVVEVVLLGTWGAPRRRRSASEEARHDRCRASCSRWPARAGSSATTLGRSWDGQIVISQKLADRVLSQCSLIYSVPRRGATPFRARDLISKEMCSPLESETPIGCGDASQSQRPPGSACTEPSRGWRLPAPRHHAHGRVRLHCVACTAGSLTMQAHDWPSQQMDMPSWGPRRFGYEGNGPSAIWAAWESCGHVGQFPRTDVQVVVALEIDVGLVDHPPSNPSLGWPNQAMLDPSFSIRVLTASAPVAL